MGDNREGMKPRIPSPADALLAFYVDSGVDVALGEAPVDRFADRAPDAAASPATGERVGRGTTASGPPWRIAGEGPSPRLPPKGAAGLPDRVAPPPAPPEVALMAARDAARSAASLDELRAILQAFEGCALRTTAKRLVFADGNPQGRVMFVGEAPGREEDLEGLPFVGRSGKLLDRMMTAIGLDRSGAYIANIIPWRPPGNRTPTPQESAICLPFILRQIELADPDVLVCLGGPAAQALLGVKEGILRTRGRFLPYHTGSREIRAIATLHPAYLLRQPLQKRLAWRDFLAIKRALEGG
jgi:uracil-DNA glycosylase family 4